MAYDKNGFRDVAAMGTPSTTGDPGTTRQVHSYITNDAKSAVETANYFDDLLLVKGRIAHGDLLMVSGDNDGTPWCRTYVMVIASNHVTLTAAAVS